MTQTTLVYLHGFQSSGGSAKAAQLADYVRLHRPDIDYVRPTLANTPAAAWQDVENCIKPLLAKGPVGVVGSSLGGFWSVRAAKTWGLRAVLINPAIYPHRLLQHFLGPQQNPYTGVQFSLEPAHIQELANLLCTPPEDQTRFWLLQQEGDEVLDYREALAFYQQCRVTLESGGHHAFSGFERHCAEIVRFLQL